MLDARAAHPGATLVLLALVLIWWALDDGVKVLLKIEETARQPTMILPFDTGETKQ